MSSTLGELADERAVVRRAIEQLHLIPVLFELGARPHPPRELYRAYLAQSHVFVGLYWQRYGWVAPGEDVSGLEDELRLSAGMPRLLYIKESPADRREPRLAAMLEQLETEGSSSYRRFRDLDELERLVQDDLAVLLTEWFEAAAAGAARGEGTAAPPIALAAPPVPLTPTVGRDGDVERIVGHLRDGVRLLTLTGAGGIGKSRLALEVVRRVADDFPDGVAFLPLEAVTDPGRLLLTLRERLRLSNPNARPERDVLVEALRNRRMLLLLDNFEQVIAAAPHLGEVLDLCPGTSAIVTSRQVLRLRAEFEYAVPPLDTDAAIDLFTQRAGAARADFVLDDANRDAVAEVCRRLDGLPLALELAAARVRLLPPEALLDRLEQRLDLLTSGAADLPERQRTLRATLDWSHRLLDEGERTLLARLSVFVGGATLEAVEAVCEDEVVPSALETLSSLLEKSLLVSVVDAAGRPRLKLLQVVRDYASERLAERGEADDVRTRHAEWFTTLVEPCDVLAHDDAHRHFHLVESEVDNLRAAAGWVLRRHDLDAAASLARRTWACAWMSGRLPEVLAWLEQLRPLVTTDQSASTRGTLAYFLGELRYMLGDFDGALEPFEEAVAAFTEAGDEIHVAVARMGRATVRVVHGDLDAVGPDADAAVEAGLQSGNGWMLGYATTIRGTFRLLTGDLAGARDDLEITLRTAHRIGHVVLEAQAHGHLAWLHLIEAAVTGSPSASDARWHLDQNFRLLAETRNLEGLGYALDAAAGLALTEGRCEDAARSLGAASGVRDVLGMPAWPMMATLRDGYVCRVRDELGDLRTDELLAEGGALDPWSVPGIVLGETARA